MYMADIMIAVSKRKFTLEAHPENPTSRWQLVMTWTLVMTVSEQLKPVKPASQWHFPASQSP